VDRNTSIAGPILGTRVSIFLRRVMRSLRLTGVVKATLRVFGLEKSAEYEKPVRDAVCQAVHANDVVWDVGANRGVYTALLSELVGPTGRVFAIEPEARNVKVLEESSWPFPNVAVLPMAMAGFDGESHLRVAEGDATGRTHRLSADIPRDATTQSVRVISGDGLVASGVSSVPDFIKIDVEGAEADALAGCSQILSDPRLRTVLVEVHFALLAARGDAYAPARIEDSLRRSRFGTRWLDRSHLLATRP
jgi:FkbM family methyltransferase